MENVKTLIEAGEADAADVFRRRPGLVNRRSFLLGSAAGLGLIGLTGCADTDGMSLAEAAKVYGPAPEEKFPIPAD